VLKTYQSNNIDISAFQRGIYLVRMLKNNQPISTQKLVIQ